jgi:peptidoglycan/xylan/chitin deacetylase (PgdA/CDA1 family)
LSSVHTATHTCRIIFRRLPVTFRKGGPTIRGMPTDLSDSFDPTLSPRGLCHGNALIALLKVASEQEYLLRCDPPLERFLYEDYVEDNAAWKRRAYYALKPFIPRFVQISVRKRYVATQDKRRFPAWPIESRITDLVAGAVGRALQETGQARLLGIAPWPAGTRFAFCITHDVEWDAGLRRAPALLEVERRVGVVSSWNLVPERYPIDWGIVDELRDAGSEIGIHGLKHDGRLFQSRSIFLRRLTKIERYAREWGAVGFRSPSCLRNPEWMKAMNFEYDSSFPDTDPYEPQPGGCCSAWPYFLGSMVELPLTMPQDHTLYEILGHTDLKLWGRKADWLERVGGLVLVNVHPDYMTTDRRLGQYEDFLLRMKRRANLWHTLPREIARWWRDRDASTLGSRDGEPEIIGPVGGRAAVAALMLDSAGTLHFRELR